jgi:CAAX protease family protein
MIGSAVSGLIFGLVYLGSGRNLWASIVAHGVTDTVGIALIFFG